jgi:hypothetical protein
MKLAYLSASTPLQLLKAKIMIRHQNKFPGVNLIAMEGWYLSAFKINIHVEIFTTVDLDQIKCRHSC